MIWIISGPVESRRSFQPKRTILWMKADDPGYSGRYFHIYSISKSRRSQPTYIGTIADDPVPKWTILTYVLSVDNKSVANIKGLALTSFTQKLARSCIQCHLDSVFVSKITYRSYFGILLCWWPIGTLSIFRKMSPTDFLPT